MILNGIAFIIRWAFILAATVVAIVFLIHYWQLVVFVFSVLSAIFIIGWSFERSKPKKWKTG